MMVRYYKKASVSVWFLSEEPSLSAKWLTNKFLFYSSTNSSKLILALFLYVSGIRNDFILKNIITDEDKFSFFMKASFPNISENEATEFKKAFSGITMSMMKSSALFKWAKQCNENFTVLLSYASALFDEYESRKAKPHKLFHLVQSVVSEFQLASKFREAGLQEKIWPFKEIPRKWRRSNDFFSCMRDCYASKIKDPLMDYGKSKTDVPDFIAEKFSLNLI